MRKLLPFLFLFLAALGCADSETRNIRQISSPTPAPISNSSLIPESKPTATPGKVTAETLTKAAEILATNTEHYAQLLKEGKAILGTQAYPSAYAGLAALDDPNSRASKFSKFNNNYRSRS